MLIPPCREIERRRVHATTPCVDGRVISERGVYRGGGGDLWFYSSIGSAALDPDIFARLEGMRTMSSVWNRDRLGCRSTDGSAAAVGSTEMLVTLELWLMVSNLGVGLALGVVSVNIAGGVPI
jgi:hypothetical protein